MKRSGILKYYTQCTKHTGIYISVERRSEENCIARDRERDTEARRKEKFWLKVGSRFDCANC